MRLIALLVALLACAGGADARSWPTRPIKLIVPTGPGAATDVMARLLADGVSRGLGQPVIVEDLPGASGLVAHQAAARAAPDGYTFLFTNTSGMAINLISFKQLPYDPTRDFVPVALVCHPAPQILSVNIALPVDTLAAFLAYARANRGKLALGFDTTAARRLRGETAQQACGPWIGGSAVPVGRADGPGHRLRRHPGDDRPPWRRPTHRSRPEKSGASPSRPPRDFRGCPIWAP